MRASANSRSGDSTAGMPLSATMAAAGQERGLMDLGLMDLGGL
jgi:hypothetical protein